MATIIQSAGIDDERLRDYLQLRDVNLRKRLESERGIYLAEGEKVVRRALEAGHRAESFLMAPRWVESLADVLETTDAPCYVLDESTIETLTGFHVHRGALAAIERPEPTPVDAILDTADRIVVVEDVMDHTNIGAIFRSAAALDAEAVLLSPRCADPLYRRSIKVAMGAVFTLPYARFDDWASGPDLLTRRGFTTIALTLAEGAVDLRSVPFERRVALLLGSEGHGLSDRWTQEADHRAVIPMRAGIDSLNVAAATAVACYEVFGRAAHAAPE